MIVSAVVEKLLIGKSNQLSAISRQPEFLRPRAEIYG
jgi:hypothetical protein